MPCDLSVLQRVKLLQFLKTEGKDVVIERAGCSGEKLFKFGIRSRGFAVINRDRAAYMPAGLPFNTQRTVLYTDVQPTAVGATIHRIVSARRSPAIETKQDGTDQ